MEETVEIVTVNYNTPDLLWKLLDSISKNGGDKYHIRVIDGSDKEEFIKNDIDICSKYKNVKLCQLGHNIHHGPGMDYAIKTSEFKYLLILDSDDVVLSNIDEILDVMLKTKKAFVGFAEQVNASGMNVKKKDITYVHPRFMLVEKMVYIDFGKRGHKFIKHGAPCINVMKYIHDWKHEDRYLGIIHPRFKAKWFKTKGRGTCGRFGYNLEKKPNGILNKIFFDL